MGLGRNCAQEETLTRTHFDYVSERFPLLKAGDPRLSDMVDQVSATLEAKGTLRLTANGRGIFPAAASKRQDGISGMDEHAWVRDNVMVAFALYVTGRIPEAVATMLGILKFLKTQATRMEYIVRNPASKFDYQNRPHIRFLAATLEATNQPWGHNQLDAIGLFLWLLCQMVKEGYIVLRGEDEEFAVLVVRYFHAVDYSNDPDHGTWEEDPKVNTSSMLTVVAGLVALLQLARNRGVGPAIAGVLPLVENLISQGRAVAETRLPFECPPVRMADAALLFSIYPTGVIENRSMQDLVMNLIEARLLGPHGINRYKGDSYYCQDFDRWFPPMQLSNDHSFSNALRNEYLQPGKEAQWCLFDPILSVIHGKRFLESKRVEDFHRQLRFVNRALSQVTEEFECPEMYYFKDGTWQPNPHTPLLWTKANLSIAMDVLRKALEVTPEG
jgi:phosphorylase kinase alpha/beta subunit